MRTAVFPMAHIIGARDYEIRERQSPKVRRITIAIDFQSSSIQTGRYVGWGRMLPQLPLNKDLSTVSQFCSQFHANSQNAESNLT
jgi:hypothetical protein